MGRGQRPEERLSGAPDQQKDPLWWACAALRLQVAGGGKLTTNMNKSRVEAFSDGVFAFAITLLVVTIAQPEDYRHLAHDLARRWPSLAAYVVSFAVIGIMWLNHHSVFGHFSRVDRGLVYLNLLLLMTVAFLPFPTGVLGQALARGQGERTAAVVYAVTMTANACAWTASVAVRLPSPAATAQQLPRVGAPGIDLAVHHGQRHICPLDRGRFPQCLRFPGHASRAGRLLRLRPALAAGGTGARGHRRRARCGRSAAGPRSYPTRTWRPVQHLGKNKLVSVQARHDAERYDTGRSGLTMTRTLFRGGSIFDGTGAPPAPADVVVEDGNIVDVGVGLDGDEEVDLEGARCCRACSTAMCTSP